MKLSMIIQINAILFIGFGIAFALYAPLMMAFYTVPDMAGMSVTAYWQIAAFARMFGAILLGFGLLLLALRSAVDQVSASTRRGIIFALLLANAITAFVSITEQSSIWGTTAGWITTGIFALFLLLYAYLLYQQNKSIPLAE